MECVSLCGVCGGGVSRSDRSSCWNFPHLQSERPLQLSHAGRSDEPDGPCSLRTRRSGGGYRRENLTAAVVFFVMLKKNT